MITLEHNCTIGNSYNLYEYCVKSCKGASYYEEDDPAKQNQRIECVKYMHEQGFTLDGESSLKSVEESLLK